MSVLEAGSARAQRGPAGDGTMGEAEPIQRQRGDLGPALIDAALDLLADAGVDALSLRMVARHVGVSAMAPYRYFPDRAALMAAVAQRGFEGLAAAMETAASAEDPQKALVDIGVAYVAYAVDHPALFRLMFGEECRSGDPALRSARDAAYGLLQAAVARAYPDRAQDALILGCWSLTHGLASLFLNGRLEGRASGSHTEIAEQVNRAMLGFGEGAPSSRPG